jgi:flagellar hook protein FlgE
VTGNLPTTGYNAGSTFTSNAFTVYDTLGDAVPLTANYVNGGGGNWTLTVNDASGNQIASQSLTFSTTTGSLATGSPLVLSASALGSDGSFSSPISIDISGLTQLAAGFSNTTNLNGNAASTLASVKIGTNGIVTGTYANASTQALYKIPVATVDSPDSLTSLNGEVYQQNESSGTITFNSAGSGSAGLIESGQLENSTVDLASQLTDMIVAQSSYEANSKVLQTVANLLSKLNQIQTS